MAPISQVADLVLIALFKQLPPADQLQARKVCLRWYYLVLDATRHRRRSLALILNSRTTFYHHQRDSDGHYHNDYEIKQYIKADDGTAMFPLESYTKWNSLRLEDSLSQDIAQLISTTYPNITKLELNVGTEIITAEEWQSLNSLLDFWATRLTTLTLSSFVIVPMAIFDQINSLSGLKHLTLRLPSMDCPMLPILARLQTFTCSMAVPDPDDDELLPSLRLYAEKNTALERIQVSTYEDPESYYQLSEQLRSRITSLRCSLDNGHFALAIFCARFPSLTSLILENFNQPLFMRYFFAILSTLSHLTVLRLALPFGPLEDNVAEDAEQMAQLKSLKALKLVPSWLRSHNQLAELQLHWTVPNVQVIEVVIDFNRNFCQECQSTYRRYDFASCLRQLNWQQHAEDGKRRKILYQEGLAPRPGLGLKMKLKDCEIKELPEVVVQQKSTK